MSDLDVHDRSGFGRRLRGDALANFAPTIIGFLIVLVCAGLIALGALEIPIE